MEDGAKKRLRGGVGEGVKNGGNGWPWAKGRTSTDTEMQKMKKESKSGAAFLEYALLVALIGIVAAVGVMKYGEAISNFFVSLGEKTTEVTPSK